MNKMNKLIFICVAAIALCGCSKRKPEVELTKETFSKLNASNVTEVDVVGLDRFLPAHEEWIRLYPHFFPVRDSNKISTIINYIKDANFDSEYNDGKILLVEVEAASFDTGKMSEDLHKSIFKYIYTIDDPNLIKEIETYIGKDSTHAMITIDTKIPFHRILFRTDETTYFIRILWDDKSFYGDWWDSPELLNYFKAWGLFKNPSQTDPNKPPPASFKNPPPRPTGRGI
jgi:hypothetical protein